MQDIQSFDDYVASLGRLTAHVDPTAHSDQAAMIKDAAKSLAELGDISTATLAMWIHGNPKWVPTLGLAVGLSQEKLKNALVDHFGTGGWQTLATTKSEELIRVLDEEYDLVRMVTVQRSKSYDFGDILVARGGTRLTATRAGVTGRRVEDEIEAIAKAVGLTYVTRTKFKGGEDGQLPAIS